MIRDYPLIYDCLAMCRASLLVAVLCHALLQEVDAGCPPGYETYNYACFLFGNSPVSTILEAFETCMNSEGYLVNIDARKENSFLVERIKEHPTVYDGYWIGGLFSPPGWYWHKVDQDGHGATKIMDFTDWGPQQPDPYGGNGDRFYSAILVNKFLGAYKWYSVANDFTTIGWGMSYICEADWKDV